MKTTMKITVESEETGTRYKISHEGDALGREANELITSLRFYWSTVDRYERAKESLPIMKEKRKEMKQRVKEVAAYIESFQTEGRLEESKTDQSVPF
jgi:hypothetical protein